MYPPLIKQRLLPRTLPYKPLAILVGQTGAGKTTLSNKLCGTQHSAGAGKVSVTQELYRNDVSYGYNAFSLIDTPGTDSSTDTYKHAVLLREALTATKINTIFVIIKYENRFGKMVDAYLEQPVEMFGKKIVVMISHSDESKDVEKDFKEICESFTEEEGCPDVSNIIFFSEQSSNDLIADLMYSCMSNMEAEKIEISDELFYLKFNIYQIKGPMQKSFKEYRGKTNLIREAYDRLIEEVISNPEDRDHILHMIIVQFRDEIEKLIEDFRNQHEGKMRELDYFTFYIRMQKENVKICDEFVEKVYPLMSYNLFDNQDPRNLIKRCPHCGLIWFKVEGCDGETTCGNQVSSFYDTCVGTAFNYVLKMIDGKRVVEKKPMKPNQLVEQDKNTVSTSTKKVGCGRTIVWKDLPKLEDELILELFKVKTIDEAIVLIKSGDFKEAKQNYENTIDKQFHK